MDSYADEAALREAIGISVPEDDAGPSLDQLQGVYEAVEGADLVGEDYEIVAQAEGMTAEQGVRLLLQNLSVQLGMDLEPAYVEFRNAKNQYDTRDVIDTR